MKILLNVLLVSLFLCFTSVSHAVKVYKWVDKQGNVTYQELPPPEESTSVEVKDIDPNRNVYKFGNQKIIQPAAVPDNSIRKTIRTTGKDDAAIRGGAAVGTSSPGVTSTPPISPSPPPLQPPPPPAPPPPGGF